LVINGGSRGGAYDLATHLLRTDTNELVEIFEIQHGSQDLHRALTDFELMVNLTERGQLGLYHANIDPHGKYEMSREQWDRCVEVLEQQLGFEGLPRAVVKHQKEGREHLHVVWQRTDIDTMQLRPDGWNYKKHELTARQLEQEFGHDLVQGKHVGEKEARSKLYDKVDATHSYGEFQQAERAKKNPDQLKQKVTALFHQSRNGTEFKQALSHEGYVLAQGNRRSLVLVDLAGEIYSLSRYTTGKGTMKKDRDAKLADLEFDSLPTVEIAQEKQKELWQERQNETREVVQEPEPQPKPHPLEIRVTEDQIRQSQALQELNERLEQEKHDLLEFQKDEQLYRISVWEDRINTQIKLFKQELEQRRKIEFWGDWGLTPEQISVRQTDQEKQALRLICMRRDKFWGRQSEVREGDDLTDGIKKYHKLRQQRYNPQQSIKKAEDRKKIQTMRDERDAEELNAFIDDLNRDREDNRQAFEREQAQERLNLEQRRQDELFRELQLEQEREEHRQRLLQEYERDRERQRGRGRDPDERER